MITTGDLILIISLSIESIILLWVVSKTILDKKRILVFAPFIFVGLLFGTIASIGFFSDISRGSLFFIKLIWTALVFWIVVSTWRQKWN